MSSQTPKNDLLPWLKSWPQLLANLELVLLSLKRRQLTGSYPCARATLEVLRSVLGTCRFQHTEHMMTVVKAIGHELLSAAPFEFAIGNVVRRILYVIREEYAHKLRGTSLSDLKIDPPGFRKDESYSTAYSSATSLRKENSMTSSIGGLSVSISTSLKRDESVFSMVSADEPEIYAASQSSQSDDSEEEEEESSKQMERTSHYFEQSLPSLGNVLGRSSAEPIQQSGVGAFVGTIDYTLSVDMRQGVMSGVNEINEEMDNVNNPIAEGAQDHIHSDECVLAIGQSHTIEHFLKAAAKRRRFQVIVAAEGQSMTGHRMAHALSLHPNISVTLVPDSAVYALMSRVHKVLFSPQAVMADGGAICCAGHLMTILAAKEYSVPVVGVTGIYKLSPLFSHNQSHALTIMNSPSEVLPYDSPIDLSGVEVLIPAYDFIPPEFIQLYITNNGSHQPSYIYRLLSEFFHPQDYAL